MDPLAGIARGAGDPPVLLLIPGPPEVDPADIDGPLFMLDRDFGGAVALPFSKEMDPTVRGAVSVDGIEVDHILKPVDLGAGTPWMLGIKAIGRLNEPGRSHVVHVEGFASADGAVMEPVDIPLTTRARQEPRAEFAEHEAIARRVAEEGIVLLENRRRTLPLQPGPLNVFGSALHSFRTAIAGAGKINARYVVGLREALASHDGFDLNEDLASFYRSGHDEVPPAELLSAARRASGTAVVVLSRASGENSDNSSDPGEYHLSTAEDHLIATLAEVFERTVVILNTPYPLDVSFVERSGVDAVVLAAPGGMLAGPALVSILDGSVTPSGRLTDTWFAAYDDIPSSRNFYDCAGGRPRFTADGDEVWIDTVYEEGLYVGYRYATTFGVRPAYPFGHGLSYTSFETTSDVPAPTDLTLSGTVEVVNTGPAAGREVVQVYLSKPDGALEQPALELISFAKTGLLQPGAHERLTFAADPLDWASWDEDLGGYTAPAGEYVLRVGASSASTVEALRFTVAETVVVRRTEHRFTPAAGIRVLSSRDPQGTAPTGGASGVRPGASAPGPSRVLDHPAVSPSPAVSGAIDFSEVVADASRARDFVAALDVEQLARLLVCGQDGWGMEGTGVAGIVARPDGLGIPVIQVADGNSGVNVRRPNIGMPTTVVLASTFDRELAREVGRVIGEEARALDVDLILAPALNLHRHPLNGRHAEYFSEDPVLAGILAGSYAAGLESTGVGACYKHLVANNAESSRKRNDSIIPERALRELYLRPFEIAYRTHPSVSVMTAYNSVNGVPTSADPDLILGFLRDELGFDGFVMTDWNSYASVDIVDMARAGMNWITPGSGDDTWTRPLVDAVSAGTLSEDRLRDDVEHLVRALALLVRWRNEQAA